MSNMRKKKKESRSGGKKQRDPRKGMSKEEITKNRSKLGRKKEHRVKAGSLQKQFTWQKLRKNQGKKKRRTGPQKSNKGKVATKGENCMYQVPAKSLKGAT